MNVREVIKISDKKYAEGARTVLRQIAQTKLLEIIVTASHEVPEVVKQADRESAAVFNRLRDRLDSDELKSLLSELDWAYNTCEARASEEQFIQGFIVGYEFLQKLHESHFGRE